MSDSLERQFKDTGGVKARFGTLTTYGHLDVVDQQYFEQAHAVGASLTFTYAIGKLTGLTNGSTLSVDGTDYTVRRAPFRKSDGSSVVLLAES